MKKKRMLVFIALSTALLISCKRDIDIVSNNSISTSPIVDEEKTDESQSKISDADLYNKVIEEISISEASNKYSIVDYEFVDGEVIINYPQITGLGDNTKQDNINKILENEAMVGFDYYDRNSTNLELEVKYNISWMSQNLLSVIYIGTGYGGTAAYPNFLFYTVNIDMNSGKKVVLSDYIMINKTFVEKYLNYREPDESMTNYALEDILSDIKEDDYLDDFNKADSKYDNQPAIFSYFTKDSLGISIDVSHLFGGHIEIELSYSDLVEYINKDCDVWKDFYN